MRRLPPQARVRLLFQDEARFGCISDQRRCWAPWPLRPVVGQQIIRESSLDAVVNQLCAGLHYLHQHHEVVHSMTCFDWINTLSLTAN